MNDLVERLRAFDLRGPEFGIPLRHEAAGKIEELQQEVEVLRQWGNKDCTAMANEELERLRSPSRGETGEQKDGL